MPPRELLVPASSRWFWLAAAAALAAFCAAFWVAIASGYESSVVLTYGTLFLMSGSAAVLWRRHLRPPPDGPPRALVAFVVGGVVTLVLANPIAVLFHVGLVALGAALLGTALVLVLTLGPVWLRRAP